MKRLAAAVLISLLLIFVSSSALAEDKLKYDFQYLFKWTASAMGVKIDPQKPQPKLVIMPKEELQRLYEKKTGEKLVTEKDGLKTTQVISGFWQFSENTMYIKNEANIAKGEILEETIVHELVHCFQDYYFPAYDDLTCLKKPYPKWNCPWEREAYATETKFRLEHGLTVRDEDLKYLGP